MKRLRRRLISWRDVNLFVFWTLKGQSFWNFWVIVGFAFFFLSVLRFAFLLDPATRWFLLAISVAGLLRSIYRFFRALSHSPAVYLRDDPDFRPLLARLTLPSDYGDAGYHSHDVRGGPPLVGNVVERVVRNKGVDRYLRSTPIRLHCMTRPRKLDQLLRGNSKTYEDALRCQHIWATRNNKLFFNEAKTCLADDIFVGKKRLQVYEASYFHAFLTSDLLSKEMETTGPYPVTRYKGTRHYPCSPQDIMRPLSSCDTVNHIGISTVVISNDGKLALWRQNTAAMRSNLLRAPTGSGSCDWADFTRLWFWRRDLNSLVSGAMEREFREESGGEGDPLRNALRKVRVRTQVLGFFRWPASGAKPEFVGVSRADVDLSRLAPNPAEVDAPQLLELQYLARNSEELKHSIVAILSGNDLSVPLSLALTCLMDYLIDDPAGVEKFIGYAWKRRGLGRVRELIQGQRPIDPKATP